LKETAFTDFDWPVTSPTLVPVSALKTCAYLAANTEYRKHHTTGLNYKILKNSDNSSMCTTA